jgi:hypothetical protein
MSDRASSYLIRHRAIPKHATTVPATTYATETFARHVTTPPRIPPAPGRLESLAVPKVDRHQSPPLSPIPRYQNDPPDFSPVDVQANSAVLHRDTYLLRFLEKREAHRKATEPTAFFEWQRRMEKLDEQQRLEIIQKRHADLDHVRRRAMRARKQRIEEQLEMGRTMRVEFGREFAAVQSEIDAERAKIRELKAQLVDRAPRAVAKVRRAKFEATREFKKQMRALLRDEDRRRTMEVEKVKDAAEKVREQARTHTMTHGDKYSAKVEITQTTFLAALTDEEATGLINQHTQETRRRVEEEIDAHRRIKAATMDKLVAMLDEATRIRAAHEDEHVQQRKEKKEASDLEAARLQREEEEKMLSLERKLEKKRQARIAEAEEMEEHTRQIAARNRYLALNKKAMATKVFQSQQDAKLRSAKERQSMRMPEDQVTIPGVKVRQSESFPQIRRLLGL